MATAAPKRITRLSSRESVRTVPERIVKPKKIVTRSSKKINVSVKNKSLHVSKGNVSLRNNQTPLIRRLRPRQNKKNYCEDSKLLRRYILPKQRDSVVVVEMLDLGGGKKVPVYKTFDPPEKSLEDKSDVYNFKYDSNDSTERAKKKQGKRKAKAKGKGKTIKKTTRKKVITRSKTSRKITESAVPDVNLLVETAENNSPLELEVAVESPTEDIAKKIEIDWLEIDTNMPKDSVNKNIKKEIESPKIDADIQTAEESIENTVENMEISRADTNGQAVEKTTSPNRTSTEQKKDTNKPRVISVENANNIIVTKSPHNITKNALPFRPKNIFNNKTSLKVYENNSSLTKILSPILKTNATNFGEGSPWRPSILTFPQTKYFIHSTPYSKFETHKENKNVKKNSTDMNKKNVEISKENVEMNKENMENIGRKDKGRKKEKVHLREKYVIQKKLPRSENQAPENVPAASNSIVQPAIPIRISLGEIMNLQRPNVKSGDNKQTEQAHTEVNETPMEQKYDQLKQINFSDTFDVMSETEKLSKTFENPPLFMDVEPTHFQEPPQHSYRRKRAVKFDFSEDSDEEEEENVKLRTKKKKPTKSEKEREKRIDEWVKTINTTFQEIDEHPLIVEKMTLGK